MADALAAMLEQLAASPADHALRARVADALDAAGRRSEALAAVAPLVNLTGHDDGEELPCLCKRCLPAAPDRAQAAGTWYVRSFAIAGNRVLHHWIPQQVAGERRQIRRTVSEALVARLTSLKQAAAARRSQR